MTIFEVPLVFSTINSINKFTYYKFCNNKIKNNRDIRGKSLLILTLIILITLSTFILSFVLINFKFFTVQNNYLVYTEIESQILFVVIISILLIFKKTKLFLKKFYKRKIFKQISKP